MRTRKALMLVGAAAVLGIGGYVAYRSPLVRSWFARDMENAAEIAKLSEKKLEINPVASTATGWPQWRGPTRDGRAPVGAFRTDWDKNPPKLLWKADCGGGYGSCAVVDGLVYAQHRRDGRDVLLCLDAKSGEMKWETGEVADYSGTDSTYATGPRATPSVEGKLIWTVDGAGHLRCLRNRLPEVSKVEEVWHKDLLSEFGATIPKWGIAFSPLIEGDLVIVQPGGKGGSVVAFDKNTGALRWTAGTNPPSYSSPVASTVGGKRVVLAFTGDALLAIRPADGKVMDSFDWATQFSGNIATPLVVDEYVFISSAYSMGCALLRAEALGDEVKLVPVYSRRGNRGLQNHHSSSVFNDRHLFGFHGMLDSARLRCVDFATGKFKDDWEPSDLGSGSGTIILADNHLIIQMQRGDLCLVKATPDEFELVAKLPKVLSGYNNWATPALVDGRLYLRDETMVVCYEVRP